MYKNQLYGVTMGFPIGPFSWLQLSISNLAISNNYFFLGCVEQSYLGIKMIYLHYIDGIYCAFDTKNARLEFIQMLNSHHTAIKFTSEKETNSKSLIFLCVQIQLIGKGYDTCAWRKPTNTRLLLNYKLNCPKTGKFGFIMRFLHRAKNIYSSCELYLQEQNKLRVIFQNNGYQTCL